MTREEFFDLIEKYNLEVDGNLSITYKKYIIGYLYLKINCTNPNEQYSFVTNV